MTIHIQYTNLRNISDTWTETIYYHLKLLNITCSKTLEYMNRKILFRYIVISEKKQKYSSSIKFNVKIYKISQFQEQNLIFEIELTAQTLGIFQIPGRKPSTITSNYWTQFVRKHLRLVMATIKTPR
ncbi:hypothetical protein RF11_15360 [Thelohanellus kitauei]|uniref:Uncharacterized protein n=1 Tax=Thelohanellus kitauei TaxID=669202 RepID=A0A0C2IU13_THEKT|nr:hypothetical protein RF11_15360 [Thelohanellus kitauei]